MLPWDHLTEPVLGLIILFVIIFAILYFTNSKEDRGDTALKAGAITGVLGCGLILLISGILFAFVFARGCYGGVPY